MNGWGGKPNFDHPGKEAGTTKTKKQTSMTPVQTQETQQQTPTAAPGPVATEAQTQALERRTAAAPPMEVGERGIVLRNFDDLWRLAKTLFRSGFAAKDCKSPEACCIVIQMGLEVGLSPMAAVQNIASVNGRPTLWGDAQMGVVRNSRMLESFEASWEIDGKRIERLPAVFPDGLTAVYTVKRMGEKAITSTFSVADARRAIVGPAGVAALGRIEVMRVDRKSVV